jgi:DNA repair exonuclease SbcCD ATPase subunit
MLSIKNLTIKNFMSVGNVTQAINFDRKDLTLVLGENIDLGGDGNRNGVGKTAIINALSYALFGQALTNIKKDNLINRTNSKGMLVSLSFSINGQSYKIERGRKPNTLKFYIDDKEQATLDDNSQGDSRETQQVIERALGMSHDMFRHIMALNTYTEPFLSLRVHEQRAIIEQLLGVTLLSEKAERTKELIKQTKDIHSQEDFRIKATQEANKRIEDQIDSLRTRQRLWNNKKVEDVRKLESAIADLDHLDIQAELHSHTSLTAYNQQRRSIDETARWIRSLESDCTKQTGIINKTIAEIQQLDENKCYACGSELHDDKQSEIRLGKTTGLAEAQSTLADKQAKLLQHRKTMSELGVLGTYPTVFYDTEEQARNHKVTLDNLRRDLAARTLDTDPYGEQVEDMRNKGLQPVNYDRLNELTRLQDHQEFLMKLLTNKDSFIRKKIIDQNLSYLNVRLTYYLDSIGLPHSVVFQNDLGVEITELGREMDFDNLSRGERNRLILSMSFAFRDVWENLYQPINLLFVDELVDSGMDTQGVENSLALLKKMVRERNKSIWLVSHRDELVSRVENILRVVKENGFTSFNVDTEIM